MVFSKDSTQILKSIFRISMPNKPEQMVRLERLDTIFNFTGTFVQDENNGVPVPHGLMHDEKMSNTQGRPLRRTK